jgi:two-component system cell cycle response regulator DivK
MAVETKIESRNRNGALRKTPNVTRTRAVVVGEEPAMCRLIKAALTAADIESVTLMNGAEAAARFQTEKFDVILVDVSAPSQDEAKLVRKIRDSGFNRKTLVIMISDDHSRDALSRAFEVGASFLVFKPIDKAHLMSLIRVTQGAIEHEKRRFRRVPVKTKVRVKSGETDLEGVTIDVSLNGALVDVSRTLPLGSAVEVSLYILVGTQPVIGKGAVTRIVGGNHMGIEFERLPVAESGRLQEYLLLLISE